MNKLRMICPIALLLLAQPVSADVTPGDVIGGENWQKADGLVPGSVLDWVKDGEFILKVGELTYDRSAFLTPDVSRSLTGNIGRYDLDAKNLIIEAATGKTPEFVSGIPFPEIGHNDPKAAPKIMYNWQYQMFSWGNIVCNVKAVWIGRSAGFEREAGLSYINAPLVGYPGAKNIQNPNGIERYCLILVKDPFDIAGTAVLLWRYSGEPEDVTMGYIPAIRRARRMSPANRSDAFVGTDFSFDDPWGYDGKISAFDWKLLRKQEALVPFVASKPETILENDRGEWVTTQDVTPVLYGYQQQGWKGAPWAPVNCIWVKTPVWVIEATAQNPYYNYGKSELWVDAVDFMPKYREIADRAGKHWKTYLGGSGAIESADKQTRFMMITIQQMVDLFAQHSTYIEHASRRNRFTYSAVLDLNQFSLAGFQKFCK
ncbi:MAG: outer membrane lipoprotein-sorting protein [bacterium]